MHLFIRKDTALIDVLEKPDVLCIDRCFREASAFSEFRFDNFRRHMFRRSLCGIVVYKVIKSKVEIDLAFSFTMILFSLVAI